MEFHFDCLFYYVSDMDASIRFYRDVLGFRLTSRDVVARFDIDGVLFGTGARCSQKQPSCARERASCLRVESVEQALKELRAKGVRTASAVAKGTGVLGTFEDPDGSGICLWQYPE